MAAEGRYEILGKVVVFSVITITGAGILMNEDGGISPWIREYNWIAYRGEGPSCAGAGQVRTVSTLSFVGCTVNLCCGLAWKSCTYIQKIWDL